MYAEKRSRKDRSRNKILDAALIEFTERGVHGTSMEALAARAGLTRATVYNLFASKEDIAFAIVYRARAQWEPGFRRRLDAGESARILLRDALFDAAGWYSEHPKIAMAILMRTLSTDMATEVPAGRASFRGLLRDILTLGQRQGLVRSDHDPTPLAYIVLGLFIPTVLYALKTGKPLTAREIDWLLQLTIEGIGARSDPK
jgi:TetR/AcrR family transcriptional regulator of autoinduction and epiphytic fitness